MSSKFLLPTSSASEQPSETARPFSLMRASGEVGGSGEWSTLCQTRGVRLRPCSPLLQAV